jgi:hypothetical protein
MPDYQPVGGARIRGMNGYGTTASGGFCCRNQDADGAGRLVHF